jgi:hypothetical protein
MHCPYNGEEADLLLQCSFHVRLFAKEMSITFLALQCRVFTGTLRLLVLNLRRFLRSRSEYPSTYVFNFIRAEAYRTRRTSVAVLFMV